MNGAQAIILSAKQCGIEVCFANPGTTEIPLVAAFDDPGGIRPVLCLYEGVCTGAADGYARMLDKPAMVLLHLGPGLANGLSNLHNARRAHSPLVVVVGEHSTWHRPLDPPLAMDIESIASSTSGWQRTCISSSNLGSDMVEAVSASLKCQVATLIVPYDLQMAPCVEKKISPDESRGRAPDYLKIDEAAEVLRMDNKTALVLGGRTLRREGLLTAARIRNACGCDLLAECFPARMERGSGLPEMTRIPYIPEMAVDLLSHYDALVFAGADEPVAFFGYAGVPGRLLNEKTKRVHLADPRRDATKALVSLADMIGAPAYATKDILAQPSRPAMPAGKLSGQKACSVIAALQPEDVVVVDESITNSILYYPLTAGVPPFTLLTLTGGSLGQGPACAVGAAVACPDRPVIDIQADGAGMYTIQSLWTQVRENLNVTTLIYSNRSYDILKLELARYGVIAPGPNAAKMTDLSGIDWVSLGRSMGVSSAAASTAEELAQGLSKALVEQGPHLIQMNL
ncbi:MAG TPA: acetolactate synthase large subunit [Desulfomonilia bacterium]|nr:acetolactate synthase large subunit [Desulfomonilia bacterium]